ncbi:MAG: RHS repeat-associated core domain-containing protein [Kiritimatiellae bacterium]|nr:RHS repeat-associated core domain-containing protein [Kiritimatiellia bacterium]
MPDNIAADSASAFMRWWRGCGASLRAFAIALLAAATIYGGGKGDGGNGGAAMPGRGTPTLLSTGDGPCGHANSASPVAADHAAFSNLCFTSIAVTSTNAVLGIGWDPLTNTTAVLDIYAKTNLLERLWRHLAEMGVDAGAEEATAELPLSWLGNPPSAFFNLGERLDSDGDGLPDAFETLATGSDPALADTDGDGLDDFTECLAGLDPSAEPPGFAAQGDTLAALELVPAFSAIYPETFAGSNVWQRTIHVEPMDGLRQYFVSGAPDGTAPPDFGGMALEWADGTGQGTVPTNQAAFPLPLGGHWDCDLTMTLRRAGAAVSLDSPLYLLAAVPRITIDSAAAAVADGVTYYAADFNATRHIDIEVDCSETPGTNRTVRPVLDGLAEFFRQSGIEVGPPDLNQGESPDNETCILPLTVSSLGVHPLPAPAEATPVRAGMRRSPAAPLRAGDCGPDSPDCGPGPPAILAIAPYIEWSGGHDGSYSGDALGFDLSTGTYSNLCEYPLDSGCIWSQWFRGASGEFECACTASVNLGTEDLPPGITSSVEYGDSGATGQVRLGGTVIWSGDSTHRRYSEWGAGESGTALLSSPDSGECGNSCGSCEGGSCDDLENPGIGSLHFRIPLSAPRDGHVDGFLWLTADSAITPLTKSFGLTARPDADITDLLPYSNRRTVRSNGLRGRQVSMEGLSHGIRLTVTNLFEGAGGKLDHIWEITRSGDTMRLRKISRAGNLMQDESFDFGGPEGATVRTDNISGRVETFSRQGAFTEDPESEIVERRTVSDASGAVFEESETVLRRFGEGHSAVEREVAHRRMTPLGTNETFATYWPDGRPLFSWGDDRPCRYTAFDDLGRETNSITYFCEMGELETLGFNFGDGYSDIPPIQSFPFGVSQTATSYEPLPGDASDPRDRDEPRRIDEYRIDAGGEPVLSARTWFIHTRGLEQGWETHTVATIRAASQNADIDAPANAVSVSAAFDTDAPGIPRVLRGKPVYEQDEDGTATRHAWSQCAFSLDNGAPSIASGATHWLCVATEEFGEEAKPVAHVTVIDAGTGSEVYSAERHVDSGIDFGWEAHLHDCRDRRVATRCADGASSTNAYSCCRLLWTQDRDGAKTLRSATTGQDSLYYAMEEVSLAQLPHDDRYIPYENASDNAFRATQHFMDAFGRETNTVVRTCKVEGVAVNQDWTCAGWRASSSVAYPFGASDYRVATDQRGGVTTTIRTATPEADIAQTIASNKTTTVTSYRNGDSKTLEEWAGVASSPGEPPLPSWRETRRFTEYSADGTRTAYSVTATSHSPTHQLTNSIARYNFLGRIVRTTTPLSDVLHAYDGNSSRVLSTLDSASGLAVTNLYDDLGEHVGQIASGIETRTETGYEVISNVLWRVETLSASPASPPLRVRTSTTRTRLAPLSDGCRSETETCLDGILQSRSFSSFDTNTLILTETAISATTGTNIVKRKFGRVIETTNSTGTTQSFFDAYGRVFYTEHDGRSVDWIGRNDFGDTEEYDTFYAWRDYVHADFHAYDIFGNRVATTNALGDTTFCEYDAENRLAATWGATYPLLYGYDTQGRRTSLSTTRDPAANLSTFQPFNFSTCVWDETRWGFDPNTSLCTNKTYADGSTVAYTYAPDGKPLRTTYPSGRWKENAYDANRRLVFIRSAGGSGGAGGPPAETNDVSFAYDVFGQRIAESNAVASAVYLRDARGNCTNETTILGGSPSPAAATTNTIERSYDDYGRLVQDSLCGVAPPREISYSSDGLIAAISNAEAVVEYAYTSDRLDAGYTLTLTNGTTFTRTVVRDAYRRNLIIAITNSVNDVAIETLEYAYDALGRPVSRNADTFGYNSRNEVVSASIAGGSPSPATAEYGYDGIGNSTNWIANCLNQYSPFTYDLDGNLLTNGVFSFTYDADNRLALVSSNDTLLATFAYDAQGRRVRKIVSHGGTEAQRFDYLYDGWLLVRETATGLSTDYVWGKDISGTIGEAGGVGGLLYEERGGDIYVPFYDNNGNITHYCDAQGNVVASYTYDAFGNTITQSGPMADTFSHRFSTKYFDAEIGLYYYGYRYYKPEFMRWLNRDPIGEDGGVNLYAFCWNNPIFAHDISGLKCTQISAPQIKPGSEWKATHIKLKNANHNFMTMIYGVFSEWQIEGFVECCCKSPFFNKSSIITKNIKKKVSYMSEGYLTPIYPQTPELPIVVINPAAPPIQPSLPTDLIDYLQDLIVGNIQEVFQELFLLAYIEKTDLELVKNAIERSKPSSYEEGEWPRNPCK